MDLDTVGVIQSNHQQRTVTSYVRICSKTSILSVFIVVLNEDPSSEHTVQYKHNITSSANIFTIDNLYL